LTLRIENAGEKAFVSIVIRVLRDRCATKAMASMRDNDPGKRLGGPAAPGKEAETRSQPGLWQALTNTREAR
jgi:hypothetical protein